METIRRKKWRDEERRSCKRQKSDGVSRSKSLESVMAYLGWDMGGPQKSEQEGGI